MRRILFLSAVSAVLTSLSFVPYNLFPLGFISLLPVFYVFETTPLTRRQVTWFWLVWIMILNLVGYHWIMHTIAVYGMMPQAVAFPLFLLYSLGTGTKMLFFFFFLRLLAQQRDFFSGTAFRTATVVAAFGLFELIGWQLFPWYGSNLVSGDLWFAQGADLFGTRGLSLIWILIQYLTWNTVRDFISLDRQWRPLLLQSRSLQLLGALLFVTHLYGFIQVQRFSALEEAAPKISIGVPQGNVPLITSYHERPYIISRMIAQTQRLISDAAARGEKTDLVVWPESSIPAMEYERSAELRSAITSLQKETQTPLIINDIYHDPATRKDYSNMWQLDHEGNPMASYQKNFLLPFGEFMPLGNTFPALKNLFPAVSDFSHGQRFNLFSLATKHGTVKAMPLVCYEIILPDYARGFDARTDHSAQFIINITNDAWFGDSYESLQHMTLGTMRAIELRLPILRSTNSGISSYTSTTGEVFGQTKMFERVNQVYRVPVMERSVTLFALAGNWPFWIYLFLTAGLVAYRFSRIQKDSRTGS
ncbi:MAG TPA: apolipoprotein N-acyltransferase [Turneriella sp.]|nr:apolipoprotein N-acyltransferase [Turneriella sp.]HNL53566.1 apolipoprotein N-acyltransferase [Turneriella sp.]